MFGAKPTNPALARSTAQPVWYWSAVIALSLTAAFLFWAVIGIVITRGAFPPEWKPSGDGKSAINTRTGEIRMLSTGESITEYNTRLDRARQQSRADQAELERERNAQLEVWRRGQVLAARDTETAQQQQLADNGTHYHAIQQFVLSEEARAAGDAWHPGQWYGLTEPYRGDEFPSVYERQNFSQVVGRGITDGTFVGPKWSELKDHLESLAGSGATWGMTRTEVQVRESLATRQLAGLRAADRLAKLDEQLLAKRKQSEAKYEANLKHGREIVRKWQMLKTGMSEEVVVSLLGTPTKTTANSWTYEYKRIPSRELGDYSVTEEGVLTFVRGKVTNWNPPEWE